MKALLTASLALALAGCAGAPKIPPDAPAREAEAPEPSTPRGVFADEGNAPAIGDPLIVDRGDMRLGTTVQYHRIPSPAELHDLTLLPSLTRVVLTLDEWPKDYARLQPLNQMPEGVDLIVVLPGWPYGRAAVDPWNYLSVPMRIVVVVGGPPPSIDAVTALNQMRGLDRVIAQMEEPSRTGFERLQCPLNFRKLIR